jgi:hypothetical protein
MGIAFDAPAVKSIFYEFSLLLGRESGEEMIRDLFFGCRVDHFILKSPIQVVKAIYQKTIYIVNVKNSLWQV